MIRLVCFCLVLVSFIAKGQSVQFYKEVIDFTLSDNHLKVEGVYYFCNESKEASESVIFYPFPVDSLNYGEVDSVAVVSNGEEIPFVKVEDKGVRFILKMRALGTCEYLISYRQKYLKRTAEYILLTTHQWHKPLEQVDYRLHIPKELELKSVSYQPDSTEIKANKKVLYWHKQNFWPDKNMVFER